MSTQSTPEVAVAASVRAEFARLCDAAIAAAQQQQQASAREGDQLRVDNMGRLIRNLSAYKTDAERGALPPSLGRRTLGITRAVGDWGESPALMDLLYPIDEIYKRRM